MKIFGTFIKIVLLVALVGMPATMSAQGDDQVNDGNTSDREEIIIPSLFEYPVAPEDLPDLQSRTDYLMKNFWNPMDFKSSKPVDQNALNHAFGVYAQSMPYATPEKVLEGVKNLIGKIKNNPGLTFQFTKAAEENIYGPRAEMWIDEVYILFLENFMSNKKIDSSKKIRYEDQLRILKNTSAGEKMPELTVRNRNGSISKFQPSKRYTLIEFGNPDCQDCRYSKLKLDISGIVNELIEDGILEVAFIIADDDDDGHLLEMASDYPEKWTVGSSDDASDNYDLRATPAFYIVDQEGKIVAKNVGVDTAINIIDQLSKNQAK